MIYIPNTYRPPEGMRRTSAGLIVPFETPSIQPTAFDFFAGAGGFSCGFKEAGWNVVGALEWDAAAATTYMINLSRPGVKVHAVTDEDYKRLEKWLEHQMKASTVPNPRPPPLAGSGWIYDKPDIPGTQHFWLGDVRKVTGDQILSALGMQRGELDCVFGGPPCQGFSHAGKRNVMDPRNSLVFEFARMILELQPKTMVMENVPGIASMVTEDGVNVVDAFCAILADGGFGTFEALRKSLQTNPSARAVVRSRANGERESKPPPKKALTVSRQNLEKSAQPALFEVD
ncbi:MAG: DNA cytosine methyltransferase [Pleurocapsa sp. SU_196_0]|nr:DNA cytosine methyltransferase [Pleurocapsa sp. SU_196_0]